MWRPRNADVMTNASGVPRYLAVNVDWFAFDVLHHEVRQVVFGLARVKQPRDVWMV
jgi:hypothetical protein